MIIKPNFPELEIETEIINKFLKDLTTFYARLISQYRLKYQTVFSARFDKQDEDGHMLDETEL